MKKALMRGPQKAVRLFGALIVLLCVTMFLFTACSIQITKQTASPPAKQTLTAPAIQTVIPKPTAAPKPTEVLTPKPGLTVKPTSTPKPKPKSTPHPTPDYTAIVGYWYSTTDPGLSVKFRDDGTAALIGAEGDCISYEFDSHTLTGTMMIDEGSGVAYPFPFSIEGGNLHFIGDVFSRSQHPLAPIYGSWHSTSDPDLCVVFYSNGHAEIYGSAAECTGYEFNADTLTGRIFLDDGGGPFPYDFSIVGGVLHLLGDTFTR